jgi:HTH-type transcriptional regulator, cell division transcriptional repressor
MADAIGKDWFNDAVATFGDRLAAAREAADLSQRGLAERLGVQLTTLQAWEDDQSEPRGNRLQMLAGMLGVPLVWLLTGDGQGVTEPDRRPSPERADQALGDLERTRQQMVALLDDLSRIERRLRRELPQVAG